MTEKDDYLFQSQKIDNKELTEETEDSWLEALGDPECSDEMKMFINVFYIPFKISVTKIVLNHGYVDSEDYVLDHLDHPEWKYEKDYVSPSLRRLYQDPYDIPFQYARRFILGFPDVVYWVTKGEGVQDFIWLFDNTPEQDRFINQMFSPVMLIQIVQLYLVHNEKELECSMLT